MEIYHAKYISSHTKLSQCPKPDRPEYAFIGRSNVGKSSLINMVCNNKSLAKTSSQPGKTQTINYYDVDEDWYLVDLPGYGYARIAQRTRQVWREMIGDYFTKRPNIQCAFLLIDSCIPPQEKDIEFANWMGENRVPFIIVFTKNDKKKSSKNKNFLSDFKKEFLKYWNEMPQYFITSSKQKTGRDGILEFIGSLNDQYYDYLDSIKE
ncbi:ribosome biogenesis GTP-binding protein YihA/YsxC [Aureispira anguillae]|uniref:Probable GTP-binding protein EngB n=1 Tax=Aureispira anguillae TaxID=2864201 RepID=A0A916DTP4_9BACT|nr:ribosome biogenesis GTP-binding protein YihA/YsxC [Aureispira anguillae]BDS11967.1 ribosome biogenesis GTP-binding protein YihA/YsxC [Aureispira anguillae]